ncbi:unnamed protein product [Caenorhabditis brenneri]
MNSANARDCLLHLARAKLSEREDLVQLNDKFVDIIEHVHYMEAEHTALEHDYNLLKTGVESNSSGINEIFESEIRNVRVGIEEINRNRQQLLSEQTHLSQQVKEAEQQWRHTAKAALGVPKEVDDDFARVCQIKYEDCLTKRRIKYMEDKNRLIKQNNGRIFEQINLMRMRKDQAVSLKQEYILRKNDLLNSIRNLEEDNKKIIMNEHKYFTRDRNADRHVFRDQLRQAIADIRADYEFKRLRNEEEIRVRLEREVARINSNPGVSITWDKLRDELSVVKTNCSGLQKQVSNVEIRNATLTQQIELLRLEISENNQSFEISLESKIKEIEKLREQCTSISVELEKLCDLNIDLEKEIAVYRKLLDQSGQVQVNTGSVHVIRNALDRQNHRYQEQRHSIQTSSTAESVIENSRYAIHTPQASLPPPVAPPVIPVQPTPEYSYPPYTPARDVSPIRPTTYSPYREDSLSSRHQSVSNSFKHSYAYPAVPIRPAPVSVTPTPIEPIPAARTPIIIPAPPTIPLPPTPLPAPVENIYEHRTTYSNSRIDSPYGTLTGTGLRRTYDHGHNYDTIATNSVVGRDYSSYGQLETGRQPYRIGSGVDIDHRVTTSDHHITTEIPRSTTYDLPPRPTSAVSTRYESVYNPRTGERTQTNIGNLANHSVSSSYHDTLHFDHSSPTPRNPRPEAALPYQEVHIEESSSSDSVDEDNFQRFTRWYKGRVKISDVTPDYVQLVNRSSKKSADIGGFKLIHEFGHKSVYVDLPAPLILAPKDSLKIYARSATHERGAVVAEIDLFDTTIHTNTSIRNTNNEVKSWFVYTSNTEIGDADHHHH